MTRPFDICIRGAGIVGKTLALHLAGKQMRVALVAPEPASDAATHGANHDVRAFALNGQSKQLLESVRCWPAPEHATPVLSMKVHGDDGGEVVFDAQETRSDALNWIVDVPVVQALLDQAVRFHPLIEQSASPLPAALTIVCEGKASQTRQDWGVQWDAQPYGQWALATRVSGTQGHQQTAHQWFCDGEILAFLPLGGPDGNLYAIVWSVNPERAQTLLHTPEEPFCQALQAASHGVLGQFTQCGERKVWPLQQAVARHWSGVTAQGIAWLLAGDAAHSVHPLAGQGLNLGLADVAEIVRVFGARPAWRGVGDPKLLRQYERARKADFAVLGQTNDILQKLFTLPHPAIQTLRNWGMNQFTHSGPLKNWVTRQAMGTPPATTMKDQRPQ